MDLYPWETEAHIEAGPILLDYYTKNNAWEITEHSAVREEKISKEDYTARPAVTFIFNLRRRDSYLRLMFVAPAVVQALLTPVLFLLPAHDTGKFTLGECSSCAAAIACGAISFKIGHRKSCAIPEKFIFLHISGGTLMVSTSIFLVMMKQYLPTSTDSLPALCNVEFFKMTKTY